MKVTREAAQVQAAEMQQTLQLRHTLQADHLQMVRLMNSLKVNSGTPPVASATSGQNLNARA